MATNLVTTIESLLPTLVSAATQGAEFLAGSPIKLNIPAEATTVTLPDSLGKVAVSESGFTFTIQKTA